MAEQIHIARTALGWSQARLARKAGIPQSTVNDIEAGRRKNPSIKTLWKLANALGVSIVELLEKEK